VLLICSQSSRFLNAAASGWSGRAPAPPSRGVQAHTLWGVDGGIEVLHDHVGVLAGHVGGDEAKQHPTSNIHVVGLH
jgi:hypothetical protein